MILSLAAHKNCQYYFKPSISIFEEALTRVKITAYVMINVPFPAIRHCTNGSGENFFPVLLFSHLSSHC